MSTAFDQNQSVLRFGAIGDGVTDCADAFRAACADRNGGIFVPAGHYRLLSDLTIDLPICLAPGAILMPDAGVTVTFAAYLDAGIYRIFGGAGWVILKENVTAYPEWFGGTRDGETDSTEAIRRAIACFPNGFGRVEFMPGTYLVSDTIHVTKSHMTLCGAVRRTRELFPMILSLSTTKPVVYLQGKTGGNPYDGGLEDVTLENLEFSRKQMGEEGSDTILVENAIYTTIQSCGFAHSQNGVRAVNVNGLRLFTVHATTGGNIPGKEVRGIFIDGSTRGSTGILIQDFIYYAYGSTKSITYGYKDTAFAGAVGGSTGDRRINNFECDGSCDYGIYSRSAGDFSCDISITDFSMDGIDICGIWLEANNPYNWQQVNITNAYFRLACPKNEAKAICATNFAFVHATNCHVDNAEGKNDGMLFRSSYGSTVTSSSFSGNPFSRPVVMEGCKQMVVSANTSNQTGELTFDHCSSLIVTANAMPSCTICDKDCDDSLIAQNLFANTSPM